MEDTTIYKRGHKMLDIFKDALLFHRKMTSFQKLVVLTFLVGGFLCIFRTLWFLCVTLTYSACLYGSIYCSRYLTIRQTHLRSDFLLTVLDVMDSFVALCRNVLQPKHTPVNMDPAGACTKTCDNIQDHATESNTDTDNIGECFYDANDVTDVSVLQCQHTESTFYFHLDTNRYSEVNTHTKDTPSNPQNETDSDTIRLTESYNKHNEHESNHENYNIVTQAFDDLSKLILRDFIKSWYDLVSEDRESLNEVDHILQIIVDHIQERLSKLNIQQTFKKLLYLFRHHVYALKQAKTTFNLQSKRRRSPVRKEETVSPILSLHPLRFQSVEECYISKVDFHIALKSKEMEKSYLNAIVEVLLMHLLPEELHKSESVVCALREILTTNVLYHVLNLLSDPTFIHEKVVQITSDEAPETSVESESVVMSKSWVKTACENDLKPARIKHKITEEREEEKSSDTHDTVTSSSKITNAGATDCNAPQHLVHEKESDIGLSSCSWKDDTEFFPISKGMCNECNRLCSDDKNRISPRLHTCSLGTTPHFFDSSSTGGHSKLENTTRSSHGESPPIVFSIGDSDLEKSVTVDDNLVFHDIPVGQDCLEMAGDDDEVSMVECRTPQEVDEEPVQKTEVPTVTLLSEISTELQETTGDSVYSKRILQDDSHLSVPCKTTEEKSKLFSNISVPSIPNISVPSIPHIPVPSIPNISLPSIPNFSVPNNFFNFQLPQFPPFRKTSASVSETNRSTSNLNAIAGDNDTDDTETKNIRKSKSSAELSVGQANAARLPFEVMPFPTACPATFQDVFITSTVTAKEAGSGSQYTLYAVQYEALYHSDDGQLVHRTGVVKRRFREFVNLQSRLEDNSSYRKSMRDVKGPKKLLSLPFFNMDRESIDSRKKLLESFLSSLIKKDDICNSEEMKQFLAYSGDGHIAFVRKVPESSGPRIDQMFVKKMSGVFDKIVEVLPSLPQELPRIITKAEVKDDDTNDTVTMDTDHIDVQFGFQDDKNVCRQLQNGLDQFVEKTVSSLLQSVEVEPGNSTTLGTSMLAWQERLLGTATRMAGDGSEVPDIHMETDTSDPAAASHVDEAPLCTALLDVLAELLHGHDSWLCGHHVMHTSNIVIGKALHRYLETKIGYLTSQQMSSFYLRTLQGSLWPDGQLSTDQRPVLTDLQKEALQKQATRCLADFLPGVLKTLLGKEEFSVLMDEIMDSVKYEKVNRHFWYTLFDVVIEMVFPEVTTEDVHRKLSTASF